MPSSDNPPKQTAALRRQAEGLFLAEKKHPQTKIEEMSPEEIQKTLHELHIHQIELEMQNEELRRSQEELNAARARYFELYDLAPVGYCTTTEEGLILEANLTAVTLLGVTRKALLKQSLNHFILKEDRDVFYLHCEQLLKIGGPQGCELRMVKYDGTAFWARMEATVVQTEGGTPHYRIVLFDISERKQVEMKLLYANEQIHSLVRDSHSIIYTISPDGIVSFVSPSFVRLLGRDPSTIVGKDFKSFIYPDDIAACEAFQKELLRTGVVQRGLEYRMFHIDGSVRWHFSNFTPCFNDQQEIILLVGNAMDITEQKRYQAELEAARKAAEASARSKSEFLALVGHEIRTPLNALVGFSALARKTDDPNILYQYLDIIDRSSQSLMDLVNDILDISKIEAGQLSLESIPFNLADTLELVAWQYTPLAEQKNLDFLVSKDTDLPIWICGDPLRFRQILANLITNAIKFTESGNVTLTVTAAESTLDAGSIMVRLEVRDTGIGIPVDKIQALFQPFQQSDPSVTRKYGGTGLGLAIVQSLVEMMHGRIEVGSKAGQGSCFVVELPFLKSVQPVYAKVRAPSVAPLDLLVVEDNAFSRRFLVDSLSACGHRVTPAENAVQALKLKTQRRYDLIILDIRMPDMDGIELASLIRRIEKEQGLTSVPIIAYTADTESVTKEQCLAAGMQAVLCKPLDPDKLAITITKHCNSPLLVDNQTLFEPMPGSILADSIVTDMGRNPERIKQYLKLLRDDLHRELNRMDGAIAADDRKALKGATHTLHGLCGHLQDQRPRAAAFRLHNNVLTSSSAELQEMALRLRSACARLAWKDCGEKNNGE